MTIYLSVGIHIHQSEQLFLIMIGSTQLAPFRVYTDSDLHRRTRELLPHDFNPYLRCIAEKLQIAISKLQIIFKFQFLIIDYWNLFEFCPPACGFGAWNFCAMHGLAVYFLLHCSRTSRLPPI